MSIQSQLPRFQGPVIATKEDLAAGNFWPENKTPIQAGLTKDAVVLIVDGQHFALLPHEFGSDNPAVQWRNVLNRRDAFDALRGSVTTGGAIEADPVSYEDLLQPVQGRMIVNGVGVTHRKSQDARNKEDEEGEKLRGIRSKQPGKKITQYDMVGDTNNPGEIFTKVVFGDGSVVTDRVVVKLDGPVNGIPNISMVEPEFTWYLTTEGHFVGMCIGSDTTRNAWEKLTALLLTRAKMYPGATTLFPLLTLFDPESPIPNLQMKMTLVRNGQPIFEDTADTTHLVRSAQDIVDGVIQIGPYGGNPEGSFLMTGTGIVPNELFKQGIGLEPGDRVIIESPVGTLDVPVVAFEHQDPRHIWSPRTTVTPAPVKELPTAFDVTDKVVVIAGGAGGIGKETAERLLGNGAKIAVLDLPNSKGNETLAQLQRDFPQFADQVIFIPFDITDVDSRNAAIDAVYEKYGKIDTLFNATGVNLPPNRREVLSFEEYSAKDYEDMFRINVEGPRELLKEVLKRNPDKNPLLLINMESIVGPDAGIPLRGPYTEAKAALEGLTTAAINDLAVQEKLDHIQVVGIRPGRVRTDMAEGAINRHPNPDYYRQVMTRSQATGRMVEPSEIGAAVHMLVSGEVPSLVGHWLIDGGWTITGGGLPVQTEAQFLENKEQKRIISELEARVAQLSGEA